MVYVVRWWRSSEWLGQSSCSRWSWRWFSHRRKWRWYAVAE
ncbi:hypothetical protein ACXZ9C_11030 [Streptococcus agalactiae]